MPTESAPPNKRSSGRSSRCTLDPPLNRGVDVIGSTVEVTCVRHHLPPHVAPAPPKSADRRLHLSSTSAKAAAGCFAIGRRLLRVLFFWEHKMSAGADPEKLLFGACGQ